jgi:hypothetical protein
MADMDNQPVLFDVPVTGVKASKKKAAGLKINRINREIAKDRYWYHKCLDENFTVNGAKRHIKTTYKAFIEIPKGQRYYINQLIKLGYNVQYELQIN